MLVAAPYVKSAIGEYDAAPPTYIYPRRDHVVLGSTYLQGDGTRDVCDRTTAAIVERCSAFVPELRTAPIKAVVVCLRPGRNAGVRVESERVGRFTLVHCYGHGGAGLSLAWGCARDVARLVSTAASRL